MINHNQGAQGSPSWEIKRRNALKRKLPGREGCPIPLPQVRFLFRTFCLHSPPSEEGVLLGQGRKVKARDWDMKGGLVTNAWVGQFYSLHPGKKPEPTC